MTPLKPWRMAGFVAPQLAMAVLGLPVVLFLQPLFALQPGLSLATVGFVFLITRVFDVVTDPTLGWIGDSITTRFGRRKFWIALNVPVMLLGVWALFLAPPPQTALALGAWLCVLYLGWTFIHMSHLSWASELAGDYDRRTTIQGVITATYLVGLLGSLVVAAAAGGAEGTTQEVLTRQVRAIGLVVLVLLPLSCALAFLAAPEPPVPPRTALDLGGALTALARNGALARVVALDFLGGLSSGVTGASLVFIAVQFLALPAQLAPLLILVSFVSGLLFVPLWAWLAGRFGKHQAVMIAAAWQIATAPLILLLPKGEFGLAVIVWSLGGANMTAPIFLARAMLGDVAELARRTSGADRTGMFFGLISASNKLGYAMAGLAYVALGLVGYDANAAAQTPLALSWLIGLYIGAPVVCALAMMAVMVGFPITRAFLHAAPEADQAVQPPSITNA